MKNRSGLCAIQFPGRFRRRQLLALSITAAFISCDVITEGAAKMGYTLNIQKEGARRYGNY